MNPPLRIRILLDILTSFWWRLVSQ